VIVRNMPGAGSLVATTHLYNAAPKDGTTLGIIGDGTVLEPLLGNPRAKYDARPFAWIGGRSRDNFLCVVWRTVPLSAIEDVARRETVVGATGPGSLTVTYPRALNDLVGTKFKIVSGYPDGNEITLALEKGEVEGYCGWALQHQDAGAGLAPRRHDQAARAKLDRDESPLTGPGSEQPSTQPTPELPRSGYRIRNFTSSSIQIRIEIHAHPT
jgi:hypothetical protein